MTTWSPLNESEARNWNWLRIWRWLTIMLTLTTIGCLSLSAYPIRQQIHYLQANEIQQNVRSGLCNILDCYYSEVSSQGEVEIHLLIQPLVAKNVAKRYVTTRPYEMVSTYCAVTTQTSCYYDSIHPEAYCSLEQPVVPPNHLLYVIFSLTCTLLFASLSFISAAIWFLLSYYPSSLPLSLVPLSPTFTQV